MGRGIEMSLKRVGLAVVSIVVALLVGNGMAACVKECKKLTCRTIHNPAGDPDGHPCRHYSPWKANTATWVITPDGEFDILNVFYDYYVCTDCDPECPSKIPEPSNATCDVENDCTFQRRYTTGRHTCVIES